MAPWQQAGELSGFLSLLPLAGCAVLSALWFACKSSGRGTESSQVVGRTDRVPSPGGIFSASGLV